MLNRISPLQALSLSIRVQANHGVKHVSVPVFRVFRTARWIFYTNLQKYLLDFLLLSELIAIFANEFQVLLREGVRFNDSNLVKGAFDIILH